MASVTKDAKGWRVRFVDVHGVRKTIRLAGIPKMNKLAAEEIGRHVDVLNSAKIRNSPILDRQTSLWLAKIGKALRGKLVAVGLTEERESGFLEAFLRGYVKQRADAKISTVKKWESAIVHLVAHFGANRELRSISKGHADEFRAYLYGQGLGENTVRRYCGIAKQFFRAAIRRQLVEDNPFSDQVAAVRGNAEKFHFLKREDAEKILKHCPDTQWKMIFVLARFGGLRCPSEVLALKWEDISWKERRITVTSPKTEHHEGKASRVIPLFPELAKTLNEGYEEAFEALQAREGAGAKTVSGSVITRYRDSTQNLRTTFLKIVKRAGLEPWPKLFQNLRSTRETELAEKYPLQAVTAWMGNSQLVAAKHYLQLRDEHFERAAAEALPLADQKPADSTAPQKPESDPGTIVESTAQAEATWPEVAHQVAQKSREVAGSKVIKTKRDREKPTVFPSLVDYFRSLPVCKVGDEGLEDPCQNIEEIDDSENGGPSGGPCRPDSTTKAD